MAVSGESVLHPPIISGRTLIAWEADFMGVDLMGVDLVGVDFVGVDLVGMNHQ